MFTQALARTFSSSSLSLSPLSSPWVYAKRSRYFSPTPESTPEISHPPHLSLEILQIIFAYSDHETLLKCRMLCRRFKTLLNSLLAESMAYRYEDIIMEYGASDYEFGSLGKAGKLLRVMDCFPVGQYARWIEISDYARSSASSISTSLWIPSSEPEILEREQEAARARFAISAGNVHHDTALPELLRRLCRLESFSLRASGYDFDWGQFEKQYNLRDVFAKPTLTEIKLSGVTNIPLAALEKATKLNKLSLSNYGLSFEDSTIASSERSSTKLDILQLKNVKYNPQEVAAYLSSQESAISITNLHEFEADIMNQDDAVIAATVLRTGTQIRVLQISTLCYYVPRETGESPLRLNVIDLSQLQRLKHLYLRISFRDGDETELNWAIKLLTSLPSHNSLTSVYIKIDIGPTGSENYVHEEYKELLGKYEHWDALAALLVSRRHGTTKRVEIVISPPDDFHKYDPERYWTLHDCTTAFQNLGMAEGLEFRMYEMPVYTVNYIGMDKSFTYN